MATNGKIAQQIEQSADYYPPGTYSGAGARAVSYLTYYNDTTWNVDTLADQYFPLSAVAQHARNPKVFAIGVIPPAVNITGLMLDRSSSINSVAPIEPQYANIQTPSGNVEIVNPNVSSEPKQLVANALTKISPTQAKQAFYDGFVQVTGQPPTDQVLALLMAQSALETGGWRSMHNYNFGNIRPGRWQHQTTSYACSEVINGEEIFYPAGDPKAMFRAYSSASEGAADYIVTLLRDNPRRTPPDAWKQALLTGDPAAFSEILSHPPPYYTASVAKYTKGMTNLYNQFLGVDAVSPDTYTGPWKESGSKNADASRQIQDKLADTPLVDSVYQQFTAAQRAQIRESQKALEAMMNTPPLRLLVNPTSFSVKGEKIVHDAGWTRNGGIVVEHWGNQQEKISASGKVAGFYALDLSNAVGPGLTRAARNYSQGWQNFQSLLLFYKNNGGLYTRDATTNNSERNLSLVGSVYIYYDSILYIGSFDSLRISEVDTAPHTMDYSFEFTVRAAFLLDNPNPEGSTRPRTTINSQSSSALFG